MKYISWLSQLYKQHGDDYIAHIDENLNPDMHKFLQHQRDQCKRAREANVFDENWDAFSDYINDAERALKRGKPDEIAIRFCELGEAIATLKMPTFEEQVAANAPFARPSYADYRRQWPNQVKQHFMDHAREIATQLWANDHESKIRLGEMCERVYKSMQFLPFEDKTGIDFLPCEPNGLKPWLRKVAPDYAKKGGAPKK